MPFSEEVVREAWQRAKGKCECKREAHSHIFQRCFRPLKWSGRGNRDDERTGWEAFSRDGNEENNTSSNCEILCWQCFDYSLPAKKADPTQLARENIKIAHRFR